LVEEALATFRELGDKLGIACALISLGNVSREEGEYEASALLCEQALSTCRELGDTHGIVVSLVLLGWAEMRSGQYSQATAHLEEALALARQLQIPNRIAFALSALGEAMVRQGDHDSAVACLEESLATRKVMGYSWGTAATLGTLGWAALRQGDLRRASEALIESLTLRLQLMDRGGVAWCLEKLVELEAAEGRAPDGARLLGAARALRDSSHTEVSIADQQDFERAVTIVRSKLSEQAFADAYELGEAMSLEQIAAYAQIASERFGI
jgi:tetratricopeptide (TPR) repeat protein